MKKKLDTRCGNIIFAIEQGPKKSRPWGRYPCQLALKKCLELYGISGNLDATDLEQENYLYLKKFPAILVSISHTLNFGASIIAHRQHARSIGIDIELSSRKVKNTIKKYINNADDLFSGELLSTWVVKEAAFKALHPILDISDWDKQLVLKDIWIDETNFGLNSYNYPMGTFNLSEKFFFDNNFLIAIACINNTA